MYQENDHKSHVANLLKSLMADFKIYFKFSTGMRQSYVNIIHVGCGLVSKIYVHVFSYYF
jgi:hypothetical protein